MTYNLQSDSRKKPMTAKPACIHRFPFLAVKETIVARESRSGGKLNLHAIPGLLVLGKPIHFAAGVIYNPHTEQDYAVKNPMALLRTRLVTYCTVSRNFSSVQHNHLIMIIPIWYDNSES